MLKYLSVILIIIFYSCQINNASRPTINKLIVNFRPAFSEASEIMVVDSGLQRRAHVLIRKNFRIDITEDTLYYKAITLQDNEMGLIVDSILKRWDYNGTQKKLTVVDGMPITLQQIHDKDTLALQYNNPSNQDSIAYGLTIATLATYQKLFRDSIVSDYFRLLRSYLNDESFTQSKLTPFMRLQEQKYEGQFRYNR